MKWQVVYRDVHGKKNKMEVSAHSREQLFENLEKTKIFIIRVIQVDDEKKQPTNPILKKCIRVIVAFGCVSFSTVFIVLTLNALCCFKQSTSKAPQRKAESTPFGEQDDVLNVYTNKIEDVRTTATSEHSIVSIKKTINPFTGEEMLLTNKHANIKVNTSVISRDFGGNKFKPKRLLFKYSSENYICGIMRTPLDVPIVKGRLPKNFDQDFINSYTQEIKINKEDTEEDVIYKQAMKQFKEEVKKEIDNGGSISQIILEARSEHNKLAEFRKNVLRTIANLKHQDIDTQELEDAQAAANIILQKEGLSPLPKDLPRRSKYDE